MPEETHLASMMPQIPTVTPHSTFSPGLTPSLRTTTYLPWEDEHMHVHTILAIVIFCVVCFLLVMAFFYAFCFHCSIGPSAKDSHTANGCNLEREEATFRHSSTDSQSLGNMV